MIKNMKRIALALCLLALCVGFMSVAAFAAYEPATAAINVGVALSGTLPEDPDTFQVEVTADEAGNPLPEGAVEGVYVMDVAGDASATLEIAFDKLGIYNYTVKQLDLGNPDCYQDTGVYKMTVFATNNADYTGLDLNVLIFRDGQEEKLDVILFENRYANPAYAEVLATKTMDKKAPKDGAFTFELVDETGAVVQTVANIGGDVTFEPILCNQIGSAAYTLREVVGADTKIIYDNTVYTVVIDVVKDENGDYAASVSYLLDNKTLEGAPAFVNKTKPVIPQTGDNANLLLWGGLMMAAAVAIVVMLPAVKRKEQR